MLIVPSVKNLKIFYLLNIKIYKLCLDIMTELNNTIFAFGSLFLQANAGEGAVLETESLCCMTRTCRRGRSNKLKHAQASLPCSQPHNQSSLCFTIKKICWFPWLPRPWIPAPPNKFSNADFFFLSF